MICNFGQSAYVVTDEARSVPTKDIVLGMRPANKASSGRRAKLLCPYASVPQPTDKSHACMEHVLNTKSASDVSR